MITKEIVKEYANMKCKHLAYLSANEKYLLRTLRRLLETKKDVLFEREEDEDKTFLDRFKNDPILALKAKDIINETLKDDPATLFIENNKNHQEVSHLSMKYLSTIYKNVKRADTFDNSIDGAILEDQKMIEANTLKLMNDPNVDVVLEGQFSVGNLRARYDILIRENSGLTLYELKGTNNILTGKDKDSIKEEYLYDLAFQLHVYQTAKIKLNKIGYMYLNKDFTATSYPPSDEELSNYFKFVTTIYDKKQERKISLLEYFEKVMYAPKKDEITKLIIEIETLLQNDVPPKKIIYKCRKCDFKDICHKIDDDSILKLTASTACGGNYRKSIDLIEAKGVESIKDIDDEYIEERFPLALTDNKKSIARLQIEYAKGRILEINSLEIKKVKSLYKNDYKDFPLVFFDFETFMYPVPLVENSHPWEQICCQYSMHVVKENYDLKKHDFDKGIGGNITHYEFIGNPRDDGFNNPEIKLLETLKTQLDKENIDYKNKKIKLVVYNESFEKTQFKRMGKKYIEYREFCDLMYDSIIDLMEFFSNGYWYQKSFNGRYSLKVTQPTLIKDEIIKKWYVRLPYDIHRTLNYKLGYIQNGGIALDVYQTLLRYIKENKDDEEGYHNLLINSLLSYCKIDSWGTVILFDIIKNVVDKSIAGSLDFSIDTKFKLFK